MTDKTELIQELRKKDIIFQNGSIDPYKLEETYGKQEAKEILNNITITEVYNTYTIGELYEAVQDEALDLLDLLEEYEIPLGEARRVLRMLEVLYQKKEDNICLN